MILAAITFDKYANCEILKVHQLELETFQFLHSLSILQDTLAAGINNILNSISKA